MEKQSKGLINKITEFGDKSISEKILADDEMQELLEKMYGNMCGLKKEDMFELEESINAYTARGMLLAYLVGFRDCLKLRESLIKQLGDTNSEVK